MFTQFLAKKKKKSKLCWVLLGCSHPRETSCTSEALNVQHLCWVRLKSPCLTTSSCVVGTVWFPKRNSNCDQCLFNIHLEQCLRDFFFFWPFWRFCCFIFVSPKALCWSAWVSESYSCPKIFALEWAGRGHCWSSLTVNRLALWERCFLPWIFMGQSTKKTNYSDKIPAHGSGPKDLGSCDPCAISGALWSLKAGVRQTLSRGWIEAIS